MKLTQLYITIKEKKVILYNVTIKKYHTYIKSQNPS